MHSIDELPLNYDLSPYTGWTREHWEAMLARLTYGYVLASERQGSPARALYPHDCTHHPDAADALEAFARIAVAWGAWLRNPRNPACLHFHGREMNLETLLRQALLEGTDATNPYTYWGDIGHLDQRIVESADVALTLWLSRERVFAKMSQGERAQVIAWLSQVDGKETYLDNWVLFPAMVMAVRQHLGYPVSETDLDSRLKQASDFYRGDGWYADGPGDAFDLYNAWMFGWHYLLWTWIDGERRPDYRRAVLARARSFLAGFQYFFGANGSYPGWGRSLVYRFAAVSTFSVGYLLNIAPANPGLLRRLCSGCLRYFYDHGALDPEGHFIRQGFYGQYPPVSESYIAPGSPSWACHGLFALTFDRDDPFWTTREAPLPVERGDFELALPAPGFVLAGRSETGQVILLNSRSSHEPDVPRHDYPSKYGKFSYSTHFPFNLLPTASGSYAPDSMVSLTRDGRVFGHRRTTRASGAAPGIIWCEFDEKIDDQPQTVRIAILLWKDLQVRIAFIRPTLPVRAFEAPGALGCEGAAAVLRRSDPSAGWEYAEAEGRAVAIRRLLGYDSQLSSAPFLGYSNLNLAYPYSEQPMVCETHPSATARSVSAVSLVRPAPFDPECEFGNIAVTAEAVDSFRVILPDGEQAFVSLADETPRRLVVGDVEVGGVGLRYVRVKPQAKEVRGMGLTCVAGIAALSSPGILWLRRVAGNVVHLTTDVGVSLSTEWLGSAARRIEAMTLDGAWIDVTQQCKDNALPLELVQEWSQRNERRLVEFKLTP